MVEEQRRTTKTKNKGRKIKTKIKTVKYRQKQRLAERSLIIENL
jgi:hypothetical protein